MQQGRHYGLSANTTGATEQDLQQLARDARAQQLQASRLRIALFKGLQVDSAEDRQAALDKIFQVVRSYLRVVSTGEDSDNDERTDEQLKYFLLTMLRLAHSCPFNDVRQAFKGFLRMVSFVHKDSRRRRRRAIAAPEATHLSPSSFVALKDIFSLESVASYKTIVSYPRSGNSSFSSWSHDTDSTDDLPSQYNNSNLEDAAATGGRPSDEYVRQMLVKTFLEDGRLPNVFRIMAFFPTFYEIYYVTFNKTLKSAVGPLSRTWRCYLGILAAAEQKCQYLVSILKHEFLQSGGDPTWLKGIMYCPRKIQQISRLVLRMARQPWRLSVNDMRSLMNSSGALLGEHWSKAELVQAIVVISTFLSLSSFVLGCGIAPEMDMRGGHYYANGHQQLGGGVEDELDMQAPLFLGKDSEDSRAAAARATGWYDTSEQDEKDQPQRQRRLPSSDEDGNLERTTELISKLKSVKDSPIKEELLESLENLNLGNKLHAAEQDVHNLRIDNTCSCTEEMKNHEQHLCDDGGNAFYENFERFIDAEENRRITLEVFQPGHPEYADFMVGEYCWEDHGCDLVDQFLPSLGQALDDEFNEAQSITDWSIFHQIPDAAVDTSPVRYAIWNCTQRYLGLFKEDYDYGDLHKYLNERMMDYIRKVCQKPYQVQRCDWNNIGLSLRPEEKCHVNLLIASARKQALLCYGLSVIAEI